MNTKFRDWRSSDRLVLMDLEQARKFDLELQVPILSLNRKSRGLPSQSNEDEMGLLAGLRHDGGDRVMRPLGSYQKSDDHWPGRGRLRPSRLPCRSKAVEIAKKQINL